MAQAVAMGVGKDREAKRAQWPSMEGTGGAA